MTAFPAIAISRDSRAVPDAGITTNFAEDLTTKQRRDAAGTRYRIQVIEEWITLTEYQALVAAYDTSLGPYDLTLKGLNYSVRFLNEPEVIDGRGVRVRVRCDLVGVRV